MSSSWSSLFSLWQYNICFLIFFLSEETNSSFLKRMNSSWWLSVLVYFYFFLKEFEKMGHGFLFYSQMRDNGVLEVFGSLKGIVRRKQREEGLVLLLELIPILTRSRALIITSKTCLFSLRTYSQESQYNFISYQYSRHNRLD